MKIGMRHQTTGNSKKARIFDLTLGAIFFALCVSAYAQQATKIRRVGYLASAGLAPSEALRQALRDLGYIEGKNIAFEFRASAGKPEQSSHLAAELVRLRVDVIVAAGAGAIRAAKNATASIPIVMSEVNDPIALGFIASLAHPGGNITGISNLSPELSGKRLELVTEIIPKTSRVALLAYRGVAMRTSIEETQLAAQSMQLQLQLLEVNGPAEFESVFEAAKKQRADALIQIEAAVLSPHQQRIIELAEKHRLPVVYNHREHVQAGGLMSYGLDAVERQQRVAALVDKILKGRKPADLPVEQPTKFEFVINLKTAKQIGITIPPNVLARADRVIK
jgi:putative tryptophan/tyrosine transport system substrate-binding protein